MRSILFRIPLPFGLQPLQIAAYGFMLALGAMFGIYIAILRAKKTGEQPNHIVDLALWVIVAGIIGARIFYIIFEMSAGEILKNPLIIFAFHKGGLIFYGALVLGIPAGIFYLKWKKLNIWKFADIAVPSIALGIAFTRIGCFLNGCCFGLQAGPNFPCVVVFPVESIPYQHYGAVLPLYPTQLISSANAFILFIILSILFSRRKFDGQVFWTFGVLYSITRFGIEFLRGDNARILFGFLTLSQIIGVGFLFLSVFMLFRLGARRQTFSGAQNGTRSLILS